MAESTKGVEVKKEVRTRKTIHDNPALLVLNGVQLDFDSKEDAVKHLEENLAVGDVAKIFLLYKEFSMKQTVVTKLEAK